jgi:hypothetical protein
MPAPESIEALRETVERRLGAYVVRKCERGGFRVTRRCRSGETHVGFFTTADAAEEFLLIRLEQLAKR